MTPTAFLEQRTRPAPPSLRCTFRGCATPPVRRLQQSIGGRPWFGCAAHYPAMAEALHQGMPGATSGGSWVEVTPLAQS